VNANTNACCTFGAKWSRASEQLSACTWRSARPARGKSSNWSCWCGPCEHELPFLQQIYEDWRNEGVILLTINLRETFSVVTQYMQSKSLSFPVLFDVDGSVTLNYNVIGIPTTFFIDKNGIIQAKRLGPFNSAAEIESYISIIQ